MNRIFTIMLVAVFSAYPLGVMSDESYYNGYQYGYEQGYDDAEDDYESRLRNNQNRNLNQYERALIFLRFLEIEDRKYWERQKNKKK